MGLTDPFQDQRRENMKKWREAFNQLYHHPKREISFAEILTFASLQDKWIAFIALIASIGFGCVQPLMVLIFSKAMNTLQQANAGREGAEIGKHFGFLALFGLIVSGLHVFLWAWIGAKQASALKKSYLKSVITQEMIWFDANPSKEIISKISESAWALQDLISDKIPTIIQFSTNAIFGSIICVLYNWKLGLILIAVSLLMLPSILLAMKMSTKAESVSEHTLGFVMKYATQAISRIQIVHEYNTQEFEARQHEDELNRTKKDRIAAFAWAIFAHSLFWLILFSCNGFGLWIAGKLFRENAQDDISCSLRIDMNLNLIFPVSDCLTGGDIVAIFFASISAVISIVQIFPIYFSFKSAKKVLSTYFDLKKHSVNGSDENEHAEMKIEMVEFDSISFMPPMYPRSVLNYFSLRINKGQSIAIVGHSGSGKTSIPALLLRFYDPDYGTIKINGKNIKTINIASLRAQIALVNTKPLLFATSILNNVAYGKPGISHEEIQAACIEAGVDEIVRRLPDGYNTLVGEDGLSLSEEESIRIGLARSLVHNPSLLIVDESGEEIKESSILDEYMKHLLVSRRVAEGANPFVSRSCIVVLIGGSIESSSLCDHIVVVHEGHVVEEGVHSELISSNSKRGYIKLLEDTHQYVRAFQNHPNATPRYMTNNDQNMDLLMRAVSDNQVSSHKIMPVNENLQIKTTASDNQSSNLMDQNSQQNVIMELNIQQTPKNYRVEKSRVLRLSRPDIIQVIIALLGSALSGLVFPIWAFLLSRIIASFYLFDMDQLEEEVKLNSLLFLVLGFSAFVASMGRDFCLIHIEQNLLVRIRILLFQSLLKQNISWFDTPDHSIESITSILNEDTNNVKILSWRTIATQLTLFSTSVSGLVIAFYESWRITLVTMALIIVILGAIVLQYAIMINKSPTDRKRDRATSILIESISKIKTIAGLNLHPLILNSFSRHVDKWTKRFKKTALLSGIGFGFSNATILASYALLFWYCGLLIEENQLIFKEMLSVILTILLTIFGIAVHFQSFGDSELAKRSASKVFEIIDRHPTIDFMKEKGSSCQKIDKIVFENVWYTNTRMPSMPLKGLSLDLEKGQSIAIVGHSGSGKTSIPALLFRFYDPDYGTIKINGNDIKTINIASLRAQIALVNTKPLLFAASILNNVAYGKPGISHEEIQAACIEAGVDEIVRRLPDGYNTLVGEDGLPLSEEESIRIGLARSLVHNPSLLIVDESGEDIKESSILDEYMKRLLVSRRVAESANPFVSRSCIVVLIGGSIESSSLCDHIVVVHEGHVVEEGKSTLSF